MKKLVCSKSKYQSGEETDLILKIIKNINLEYFLNNFIYFSFRKK